MSYATIVAVEDDPAIAKSDTKWRRDKPTPAQVYRARSIGVLIGEHDTRGDVADKLTARQASITLASVGQR